MTEHWLLVIVILVIYWFDYRQCRKADANLEQAKRHLDKAFEHLVQAQHITNEKLLEIIRGMP